MNDLFNDDVNLTPGDSESLNDDYMDSNNFGNSRNSRRPTENEDYRRMTTYMGAEFGRGT